MKILKITPAQATYSIGNKNKKKKKPTIISGAVIKSIILLKPEYLKKAKIS